MRPRYPRRASANDLRALLELDMESGPPPHHTRRMRRMARMPVPGARRVPGTPNAPRESGEPATLEALLNDYATNLTEQLKDEAQVGVYGRDAEIEQVLQALASPLKGRIVVTGEARVGKTAIIHEVVRRIVRGDCPDELKGAQVWATSPAAFLGGYPPANWLGSLDEIMSAWRARADVILYFDDLPSAAGGLGADEDGPDLALTLLAHLRRSTGRVVAEGQAEAWRRFVDRYRDYEKQFLSVRLNVPEAEAAREIIQKVCDDLAVLREITIAPSAIDQAYDLTGRYFLDRSLPGKVIDLLRDTLTVATPSESAGLTSEDVTLRFATQTGLPRMLLTDDEPFDDRAVREYFRTQVLAQDQAVEAIVQALSLLRARVNNPTRPMGVFLFLGPTGVGKTEMARALSTYLYGGPERLLRFNMADYVYPGQYMELFGNPYIPDLAVRRGQITTRLAGHPFSVIVLDEFEKAEPTIFQRFLQLFDEGLLINAAGETINLRNSIFILTSNFGARLIQNERVGFHRGETMEEKEARVLAETENYFTPEFINRIDAVCVFKPLSRTVMGEIARREVGNLLKREGLIRRSLDVDIDDEVFDHVVNAGYSERFGARYLKRQIEKTIAYPLAQQINRRDSVRRGAIRLFMKQGRVSSTYLPPEADEPETPGEARETGTHPETRRLTLAEIRAALPDLERRVAAMEQFHHVAAARDERDSLMVAMSDAGFWSDQASARHKLDAFQRASNLVDLVEGMRRVLEELGRLCAAEDVPVSEAIRQYNFLLRELPRVELTSLLSGPYDALGAYLQIRAKARTDAGRKWLRDLAGMYLKWAESRSFAASVVGEEVSRAGTTQAVTIAISGHAAYGLLRAESGIHRLVLAGGDGASAPQKVAAQVQVWPELTADSAPPLPPNLEAEIETVRQASDRSGLFTRKLTTNVVATHPASGRSLSLSGAMPPDDLAHEAARLLWTMAYIDSAAQGEMAAREPNGSEPGGGLVRTYSRHRERGVRDHRTGLKVGNLKKVLDGGLDEFLEAALKANSSPRRRTSLP